MKTLNAACVALLIALTGCGAGAPELRPTSPTAVTEAPTSQDPASRADAYALEKSGGESAGCSEAAPGKESEENPGCQYAVAFTGCLEGITGEHVGPLSIEEEWASEPALVALGHQAVADCAALNLDV